LQVEISVVELNQTLVDVQQGTWSASTDGSGGNAALTTLDRANTFAVFSYTLDAATTSLAEANFRCYLSADDQIDFARLGAAGPAVSGHWFTAEALSGEFDVQTLNTGSIGADSHNMDTDPDWNGDETAIFTSYSGCDGTDSLFDNCVYLNPSGDPITAVNTGRGGSQGDYNGTAFLVHFTGNEKVYRQTTNAATGTNGTRSITDVSDADVCSIHSHTQPFLVSGYTNNAGSGLRDDYAVAWTFNGEDTDTIRWDRLGSITGLAYPPVQVVKWDVAAAAAVRRVMVSG
jgi:hypothetical protein